MLAFFRYLETNVQERLHRWAILVAIRHNSIFRDVFSTTSHTVHFVCIHSCGASCACLDLEQAMQVTQQPYTRGTEGNEAPIATISPPFVEAKVPDEEFMAQVGDSQELSDDNAREAPFVNSSSGEEKREMDGGGGDPGSGLDGAGPDRQSSRDSGKFAGRLGKAIGEDPALPSCRCLCGNVVTLVAATAVQRTPFLRYVLRVVLGRGLR